PAPLTGTTAHLRGSANPGSDSTTGWFRYDTVSPGTCNDSFGTRAPVSGGTALGSGTAAVAYSADISGLTPLTTYYVCAISQNSLDTGCGAVVSFKTPAPPVVTPPPPSDVLSTSATLNGSANPNFAATTAYFRYSPTNPVSCNDTFGSATTPSSVGSGGSLQT